MTKEQAVDMAREVRTYHDRLDEIGRTFMRDDWLAHKEHLEAMQAGRRVQSLEHATDALWRLFCTLTAHFDLDDKEDLGFATDLTEESR